MTSASAFAGGAPARYEYDFQRPFGARAVFHVSGTATGASPDVEGDAVIDAVEYRTGDRFEIFYRPVEISNIEFSGNHKRWQTRAGSRCTVGLSDSHVFGAADGQVDDVTAEDVAVYEEQILAAFRTNNLNNYLDLESDDDSRFTFTIAFDHIVRDNDPGSDEVGEILYIERGTAFGHSWVKLQAVDEDGSPLGPWLVIAPHESAPTSPHARVYRTSESIGATAIDVSRLGVSEFQHLRVSNDVESESAYNDGGDIQPDFKIMAIVTNKQQLQYEILGGFD
jgi:hypothetical protein